MTMQWIKKQVAKHAKRPNLSLPLAQTEGNRMLIGIIAILVFVSGLAWMAGSAAEKMSGRWDHALSNELTVELSGLAESQTSYGSIEQRAQQVREVLSQYNAITSVQTVERAQLERLLKPWLGEVSTFSDLPIPTLITVSLQPGHQLNFQDLARQISERVPGVRVIIHDAWAGEIQRLARTINIIAMGGILAIGMVLFMVMVFSARARLAMYGAEVDVLHTLGATDGFVAGEFQAQAFRLSFIGAMIGFAALLLVMGYVVSFAFPEIYAAMRDLSGDLSVLSDWRREMIGLLILPIGVVILNMVVTRLAVLAALRRLV